MVSQGNIQDTKGNRKTIREGVTFRIVKTRRKGGN